MRPAFAILVPAVVLALAIEISGIALPTHAAPAPYNLPPSEKGVLLGSLPSNRPVAYCLPPSEIPGHLDDYVVLPQTLGVSAQATMPQVEQPAPTAVTITVVAPMATPIATTKSAKGGQALPSPAGGTPAASAKPTATVQSAPIARPAPKPAPRPAPAHVAVKPTPRPAPRPAPIVRAISSVVSNVSRGARIVSLAMAHLGQRYAEGAEGPYAWDCSGLVQFVYRQVGVYLPRTAAEQWGAVPHVSRSSLQLGDLVFFQHTTSSYGITHVGLYIGAGRFINAQSTRVGVAIESLGSTYWSSHYAGAGRPR